ncbi:putative pentatricopeptide repeat-containing protein At3g01580 [Pyrus communis]|uniref:putative pentatricopeptide repeat-containing protein At3g01580 n=1 Tax=Pyrus communis TaxID=23211 RepID=UPI0035BF8DE6
MKRREVLANLLASCNCAKSVAQLHSQTLKTGLSQDSFFATKLNALYAKYESLGHARKVFDETPHRTVYLWNAMLRSYCREDLWQETLCLFRSMMSESRGNDEKPDNFTIPIALKACARLRALSCGKIIHGFVKKHEGVALDMFVGSALIELYSKCGEMGEAVIVFDEFSQPDVFLWTSMVTGYEQNGDPEQALEFLSRMVMVGRINPDRVTLVSAVSACAQLSNFRIGSCVHGVSIRNGFNSNLSLGNALLNLYAETGSKLPLACSELGILEQALCLHAYVIKRAFKNNIFVGASLIELYPKSGSIGNAILLFEGITDKDVVIWSAMIAGHGVHGQGEEAIKVFDRMVKHSDVKPNDVTFLSILSVCSHSGLVEEGIEIFNTMLHEYQLKPGPEHYGIIVDLLGQTGELDKAMEIVERMPNPAGLHVWGALLGACWIHNNTKLGEVAAKSLFRLDPNHSGYYIPLSDIYAMDNKWENVTNLRTLIKEKWLKKMSGQSVVEVGGSDQIYGVLGKLEAKMREDSYVPNVDLLLHDMADAV